MAMMVGLGSALTIGGLILAYAQGGGFASIPVVGALAPWRQMFVVAGACGAIVVLLLTLVPEPARRNAVADGAGNPGIRTILRYPATLLVVVAAAMCAIGDYTIMAWVPALLIRKFGMSAPEIGASLGLAVIVAAVASPLIMGVIGDRVMKGSLSARFLLSATLMTLATGIFLLGVTDRADVVIFLSGAWMFCSVAALSSAMTAMQEITPSRLRGTASALIAFGSAVVGLGIGTAIVGALSDHVFTGPGAIGTSVAVTSAFAAVSAAALFWKLWFDERRGRIASLEAH
jgi:predicted MFS family arabinose efflux permease